MNFIKKIVDKEIDDSVHLQFMKFSRGEFKDRAIVKVKQSKGKYTIYTTHEFANEFVLFMANKLGEGKTNVTGAIVSTSDLKEDLDFKEIKQFQGVKRYLIDNEMSGLQIKGLIDKFPKAFFALSFSVGEDSLKIKPKAPKSAKAKNKGESPKPDFCKLVTLDKKVGQNFVIEMPEFKSAEINHAFIIEDIIVDEEMKKEKDFAKVREMARRKGKIIRKAIIDGKEMNREIEFEV